MGEIINITQDGDISHLLIHAHVWTINSKMAEVEIERILFKEKKALQSLSRKKGTGLGWLDGFWRIMEKMTTKSKFQ